MTRRLQWLALGAIVVVAAVLDAVFYTGYYASDDREYLLSARAIIDGEPLAVQWAGALRLAINLPNAVIYWLSGGSHEVVAWAHIFYHLALVVIAYALGRVAHRDEPLTGLVAAALVATNPVHFVYAGAVLPDNATAMWAGGAFLVLERCRTAALSTRAALAHHAVAGALVGLAYSCKETAIILTVPAAIAIIAAAPRWRDPVWLRNGVALALGLALVLAAEAIALRLLADQWLFRLGGMEAIATKFQTRVDLQGGLSPLGRIDFAENRIGLTVPITMNLFLIIGLIYPWWRGRNVAIAVLFWWVVLYLTFGTTSFTHYVPPSIQTRYYALACVPAAIMTAALALAAIRRVGRRWPRLGPIAAAVVFAGLLGVATAEVVHNLPKAGDIYRADTARAFARGLAACRAIGDHPIVVGRSYIARMAPLIVESPSRLYAERLGELTAPPPPPFLFLHPSDDPDPASALGRIHKDYDLSRLTLTRIGDHGLAAIELVEEAREGTVE